MEDHFPSHFLNLTNDEIQCLISHKGSIDENTFSVHRNEYTSNYKYFLEDGKLQTKTDGDLKSDTDNINEILKKTANVMFNVVEEKYMHIEASLHTTTQYQQNRIGWHRDVWKGQVHNPKFLCFCVLEHEVKQDTYLKIGSIDINDKDDYCADTANFAVTSTINNKVKEIFSFRNKSSAGYVINQDFSEDNRFLVHCKTNPKQTSIRTSLILRCICYQTRWEFYNAAFHNLGGLEQDLTHKLSEMIRPACEQHNPDIWYPMDNLLHEILFCKYFKRILSSFLEYIDADNVQIIDVNSLKPIQSIDTSHTLELIHESDVNIQWGQDIDIQNTYLMENDIVIIKNPTKKKASYISISNNSLTLSGSRHDHFIFCDNILPVHNGIWTYTPNKYNYSLWEENTEEPTFIRFLESNTLPQLLAQEGFSDIDYVQKLDGNKTAFFGKKRVGTNQENTAIVFDKDFCKLHSLHTDDFSSTIIGNSHDNLLVMKYSYTNTNTILFSEHNLTNNTMKKAFLFNPYVKIESYEGKKITEENKSSKLPISNYKYKKIICHTTDSHNTHKHYIASGKNSIIIGYEIKGDTQFTMLLGIHDKKNHFHYDRVFLKECQAFCILSTGELICLSIEGRIEFYRNEADRTVTRFYHSPENTSYNFEKIQDLGKGKFATFSYNVKTKILTISVYNIHKLPAHPIYMPQQDDQATVQQSCLIL